VHLQDLIADHASGSWVWTVGGTKVLDFGCGRLKCSGAWCTEVFALSAMPINAADQMTDMYYIMSYRNWHAVAGALPPEPDARDLGPGRQADPGAAKPVLQQYCAGDSVSTAWHGAHMNTSAAMLETHQRHQCSCSRNVRIDEGSTMTEQVHA
jgi:hypothetical protein